MKVAFVTALLAGLAVAAPSREVKAREEAIAKRNPLLAAEIGYGIVGGAVYYIANKILSSKRSAQSYEEVLDLRTLTCCKEMLTFSSGRRKLRCLGCRLSLRLRP